MNKLRIVLLLMILLSSQFLLSDRDKVAYAQQTSLNDAVPAVVRILGCNVAGCNVGLGSGVLIHASGVVLTANHVTLADLNDPTSQLEDFLIEMTTSAQLPPQARYRARLIAFKPESDLALLRIYWDEIANQAIDVTTLQDLPTLPLANAETIMLGEEVHILGYPLAGGRAINYAQLVVGGFDEGGALIKVSTTLSEGNSGGPALVERNGRFEIAGIVLRRRGTLGEIGFIRRIDQLQEMIWLANAQRVWVDNIQVSTQGTGATASLQISAEIHALDMVNRHIYLLAYAFEATTYLPWRPSPTGLPKSATGQVVFSQAFVAQQVIAAAQTMTLEQHGLGVDPQQLRFRLLLWDSEATQVLWQDTEWRSPQPATAVALAPPPPTATQTVSATPVLLPPTPTETPMPPTATATMTPLPDLIASATAIAQMVATAIAATQTALPTNTPTATATPNLAATTTAEARRQETAIAATLTAQPAATPTATQTPSFDQVIATAVAATLTALPADTPTRMPTTTPTTALTSTRTPLPTKAPTATWTPTRTPTRTPTLLPCKPGVLYCEDFEDGQASGWRVSNWRGEPSSGWKVSRDNTNYVFTGEGHQWATLDNRSWDDYRFSFRLKLIRGTIHLIYRLADGRYYVGFNEDGLYLNKSLDNGPGFIVYSAANTHTLETWHQVELVGWGGHLQVYVDGRLELDYVDSNPLLKGMIAFETLDGSAAQIDDIEVAASGPEQVSSQTSTPGLHPELVIDAANLNVRDGPGSSYKVLGVAKSGERYTITGRNSNSTWWQIDFNGRSGWISGGYVRVLSPDIAVPIITTAPVVITTSTAPSESTNPAATRPLCSQPPDYGAMGIFGLQSQGTPVRVASRNAYWIRMSIGFNSESEAKNDFDHISLKVSMDGIDLPADGGKRVEYNHGAGFWEINSYHCSGELSPGEYLVVGTSFRNDVYVDSARFTLVAN